MAPDIDALPVLIDQAARLAYQTGLSILPVASDGSKQPEVRT